MFTLRLFKTLSPQIKNIQHVVETRRDFKRWVSPTLRELYRRRKKIGPAPPIHRSTKLNWNFNAELYAFSQRLNENFKPDTLRAALTHPTYIQLEETKRKAVGMTDAALKLTDNSDLIAKGEAVTKDYIPAYLRFTHPFLPEEGILSINNFLVSEPVLSHVCANIGTLDLILCEEMPPSKQTLAKTMKAIIGAIASDTGSQRAEMFVQDFILTQLVSRDVNDLWPIVNPMGVLVDILKREGRELPESRMIRQSGTTTIQAVYNVGVYSAQKLIGVGPGETVSIAEEMAARDALKRLFQTGLSKHPLPLGSRGHQLNIKKSLSNPSLSEWTTQLASQNANLLLN